MRYLPCLFAMHCSVGAFSQVVAPSQANLIQRAESAYQAKQYQESVALYKQALPSVPEGNRAGTEYNMACAQALAGDHNGALATLKWAVEDGYTDQTNTEADKDLISLHDDPRWKHVLTMMSSSADEQNARWGDKPLAVPYADDLSPADKITGLSELWAQAEYGFANFWHVPQLNWDQTYKDFVPRFSIPALPSPITRFSSASTRSSRTATVMFTTRSKSTIRWQAYRFVPVSSMADSS